jgi:hypothetical protein
MPEWLKGADCKSASESLRWFESISTHHFLFNNLGSRKAPFLVDPSLMVVGVSGIGRTGERGSRNPNVDGTWRFFADAAGIMVDGCDA